MTETSSPHTFDTQRRLVGLRLGRYVMGPRLGAGGTASVYLARETLDNGEPGRLVGLKVIHDHLLEEADFVRMFVDEANLVRRMSHPNVVEVYEFGQHGESLFLAMEYLHGQPLSRLFEKMVDKNQRLPFDLVMWIGARVADGLSHAHMLKDEDGTPLGVIHRDVSPQNIFVTYDGQVKLIDFGIAKAEGRLAKTTLGRIKGKFSYMAPEQVLGNDFDQRADLFALGATLYELTVGVRLFAGDDQTDTLQKLLFEEIPDPADKSPDCPTELSAVIRKALAAEPGDRYGSAASISRDLATLLATRGMTNGQPALARLMTETFAQEMRDRTKAIEVLRSVDQPETSLGRQSAYRITDDLGTPDDMAAVHSAHPAPRRRATWLIAGGVAALIAAAAGTTVIVVSKDNPDPAPIASAPVQTDVTLDIKVQPPVEAKVFVGGKQADGPRVVVAKGSKPVTVRVEAEGYEVARIEATPDRDQLVVVPLLEKALVVSAPSVSASAASGGAGGAAKTGKPGTRNAPPKSTTTGSLVTDYPF